MILIIEILLLVTGIYALITGKIPGLLFGGGQYSLTGPKARLLGLWLMVPVPAAFIIGLLLALFVGESSLGYSVVVEVILIVGVILAAVIAFRLMREPVAPGSTAGSAVSAHPGVEAVIARKANGALIYSLLGALGFTAIVVGPLAILYATQALRLIDQHQLGQNYRSRAQLARIIAVVIFVLYAGLLLFIVVMALPGYR